jgi:hypothetical protein
MNVKPKKNVYKIENLQISSLLQSQKPNAVHFEYICAPHSKTIISLVFLSPRFLGIIRKVS